MAHTISQHWDAANIVLSYAIAVTGSYCTIQLMEQWRQEGRPMGKLVLLALSSMTLGGCGIWCMHFTGMRALHMTLDDGTVLDVNFDLLLTILSLLFPILGVFLGLFIASHDQFFLEIEQGRRKDLLGKKLGAVSMDKMVKREAIGRRLKHIALFSRLWFILGGACFAALGVLGMHYLGMLAQRANAAMTFDPDIVALSCVVALGTATAAFWILFRALTFWPGSETLRLGSALIMGVAVCGTHYVGMGAASYEFRAESYEASRAHVVDGARAASVASHASILVCFWSSTFGVMVTLRRTAHGLAQHAKKNAAVHPEGARTTVAGNRTTFAANRSTRQATFRLAPAGGGGGAEEEEEVEEAAVAWPSQAPPSEGLPCDAVRKPSSVGPSEASIRPARPTASMKA